jgi:hypothetical protein
MPAPAAAERSRPMAIKTPSTDTEADPSARQPGETAEEHARRLRQIEKNQAAIALLDEWRNTTDPEVIREQKETWQILKRALGKDRTISSRNLYPDELYPDEPEE